MRIVISGANSFIGKALLKKGQENGWETIAVVRNGDKKRYQEIAQLATHIRYLNMEDYSNIGKEGKNADCFVHLAWNGTRGTSRLDTEMQKQNYEYSINAIKSMLSAGCKRIITAGSQAEYGIHSSLITEQTMCKPNTAYGEYKLKLYEDAYLLCKAAQIPFKEPRYFSLYGPEDYENTLIMSCIRNMLENAPCNLTQSTQLWDYLYIDDAVDALSLLCTENCEDGAYNFASGDCRVLRAFIEEIKSVLSSNSCLNYGAVPYTKAGIVSIHPSIEKLCTETGWKPKTTFAQGICQIAETLKDNRA